MTAQYNALYATYSALYEQYQTERQTWETQRAENEKLVLVKSDYEKKVGEEKAAIEKKLNEVSDAKSEVVAEISKLRMLLNQYQASVVSCHITLNAYFGLTKL